MNEDKLRKKEGESPELQKLNINGDIYYTTFTKKFTRHQLWSKPDLREVISHIPGTVREILVKEGDNVNSDQKMLILEAMKMMNTIYSPVSGKIKSIKVKVGDCIPKGTVMIEFE